MTAPILPRLADDLIAEALTCACDASDGPMCARCECLVELAHAIDIYSFEQVAGVPWHVAASRIRQANQLPRLGALSGLWYTTLGWLVQGYAALYAVCWVLPHAYWRRCIGGTM